MLRQVWTGVAAVPERVKSEGNRLFSEVERTRDELARQQRAATRWVKRQAWAARERGESRLWDLQLQAFSTADGLADGLVASSARVPLLQPVGERVRQLVQRAEAAALNAPLAGYDELNVREILAALRDLDRNGLRRVERAELAGKNRKTIVDAIHREVARRARLAEVS